MKEEKLIQFVQWLPTKIKELENAKPEQIVELINQMGQTEDGINQLNELLQEFEKEQQTISMKLGGKFEYIKILRNGGCPSCKKTEIRKIQKGGNSDDLITSMLVSSLPNMNFIQRKTIGPNKYVHELSATREGLNNPTLARMIGVNPTTKQPDTTYVLLPSDPYADPIFTPLEGQAKRDFDSKIEELRNRANSKGIKIRK